MGAPHRLEMRVSEELDRLLREAAADQGQTLTGFVCAAVTERARQVIEQARRIEVSTRTFQRFTQALKEPDEDIPNLRRYAQQ